MTSTDLAQRIHDARSKLTSLADEIRVRIHLGGMDLKDKWNEFEPQLIKAERAAHQASEGALQSLHELAAKLEELGAKLKKESSVLV